MKFNFIQVFCLCGASFVLGVWVMSRVALWIFKQKLKQYGVSSQHAKEVRHPPLVP